MIQYVYFDKKKVNKNRRASTWAPVQEGLDTPGDSDGQPGMMTIDQNSDHKYI